MAARRHRSIFGDITDARKADIPAALTGFASKAFRRSTPRTEIEHHISYVQDRIEAGTSHEEAIKAGMAAILVSLRFLFLDEGDLKPIRSWMGLLATRLSYALGRPCLTMNYSVWPHWPIAQPEDIAGSGRTPAERPTGGEFSRRFPKPRWLDKIGTMPPSGSQYPSYYANRLEPAMKKETSFCSATFSMTICQ